MTPASPSTDTEAAPDSLHASASINGLPTFVGVTSDLWDPDVCDPALVCEEITPAKGVRAEPPASQATQAQVCSPL